MALEISIWLKPKPEFFSSQTIVKKNALCGQKRHNHEKWASRCHINMGQRQLMKYW